MQQEPPDVSVVVPVHDTMPYLTECLDSLLAQTLRDRGPGVIEVLAIDDGSTDGSGELLDRYAADHPGVFLVEHHRASGGPATPRNRALELARGRFLFFLDADDHLAPEALEHLVAKADEWDSDVVFGRMVGTNGRFVDQRVFATTRREIGLDDPALPFALAVTKLFRRSMVDEHRLRFDPALRIGSDQPFTVAAMVHSRRTSVLADQAYYFAVRREDASNITYAVPWRTRLTDIGTLIQHIAASVPVGDVRDNVLHRHFGWELIKLLRRSWPTLTDEGRLELCSGVGSIADAWLTDGISRRLGARTRLAIRLAQAQRVDLLSELFGTQDDETATVLCLRPGRVLLGYPGIGTLPEDWFEMSRAGASERLQDAVVLDTLRWDGRWLHLSGRARVDTLSADQLKVVLVPLRRRGPVVPVRSARAEPGTLVFPVALTSETPHGHAAAGSVVTCRVDVSQIVGADRPKGQRWGVFFRVQAGERSYDLAARGVAGGRSRIWTDRRFVALLARRDADGSIFVRCRPLTFGEVAHEERLRMVRLPRRLRYRRSSRR